MTYARSRSVPTAPSPGCKKAPSSAPPPPPPPRVPAAAFAGRKKGAIFVDHTTASAEVARELDAAAAKAGFKFIDAPVSGGQAGAENGVLTVMCGVTADAYADAEPVIAAYARMCKLLGPAGSGQLT